MVKWPLRFTGTIPTVGPTVGDSFEDFQLLFIFELRNCLTFFVSVFIRIK